MKPSLCATVAVLAIACTSPNPDYVPGTGVTDGGGSPGGADGGVRGDLGPSPGGDMTTGCMAGERICLASTGSAACMNGQYMLDRKCPDASMCQSGYCQPPPMSTTSSVGMPCDQNGGPEENSCFTDGTSASCQPFVTNPKTMTVGWFCDTAVGAGRPGDACTSGSDCRSGFCGSNGTCFRACTDAVPCPIDANTGTNFNCSDVDIVVEGVKVTAKSCVP